MIEFATLNNAGDSQDNPILQGLYFTIRLEKHVVGETLKSAYVEHPYRVIFNDLTASCVESDSEVTVEIRAGVDVQHADPAALNVVHFATTYRKVKRAFYVVTAPGEDIGGGARLETPGSLPHRILLDGFNGDVFTEPHIIHFSLT